MRADGAGPGRRRRAAAGRRLPQRRHSPDGEAFRARTDDAVATRERVRPRFETAAETVAGYARALRQAQDDADAVLAGARRARDDREAADRAHRTVGDDPEQQRLWASRAEQTQGRLDAADRALAEVEAGWWLAGSRAAAALEDATAADDLTDGWDLLGAVAVLADVAGQVPVVLGGAAMVAPWPSPRRLPWSRRSLGRRPSPA